MKIIYKTGNLLEAPERFVCHQVNARGVMGSGVAAAIRTTYPLAYDRYIEEHRRHGLHMGQTIWVDCGRHTVIHLVGQRDFGRKAAEGHVYADYDAIRKGMRDINSVTGIDAVAMPLIGAGLAGGHWPTITQIIEEESTYFQPVVYLLDGKIPN